MTYITYIKPTITTKVPKFSKQVKTQKPRRTGKGNAVRPCFERTTGNETFKMPRSIISRTISATEMENP